MTARQAGLAWVLILSAVGWFVLHGLGLEDAAAVVGAPIMLAGLYVVLRVFGFIFTRGRA